MEQQSLFGNRAGQDMPLATRMRPRTLEEFAGQRHLLGKGKVLRQLIDRLLKKHGEYTAGRDVDAIKTVNCA